MQAAYKNAMQKFHSLKKNLMLHQTKQSNPIDRIRSCSKLFAILFC